MIPRRTLQDTSVSRITDGTSEDFAVFLVYGLGLLWYALRRGEWETS